MLELKTYPKPELSTLFGTKDAQGLERKMKGYGLTFNKSGNGERAIYLITEIKDPFKIFCITELDRDGRTHFDKLRNFYYLFFNDEEFMAMPDEVKEHRMRKVDKDISRQTIAKYIYTLEAHDLINRYTSNFIYYFAFKQNQRMVEREEYLQAWHEYWADIGSGLCSFDAIENMRAKYGGVARKQAIPEINGIYNEKIELMLNCIVKSIENEMGG